MAKSTEVERRAFEAMVAFVQRTQRAAAATRSDMLISPADFAVLRAISARTSLDDLAAALGTTRGVANQRAQPLVKAGLVELRGATLVRTDRGEQVAARQAPAHDAHLRSAFVPLSEPERAQLLALLERLSPRERDR